ncbi:hypothetical protein [Desulfonema magnum]|uniref:Uncharacterized protein n=1 Tax=Desulfonema magnum TaxID=45655 RepID=A0A975BWP3_9BACT|nr:hypothetical protein [Desulfonema magnum]QTA93139.1 Uncharacterized protein dnm_092360 [Desulfonema magnum]
MDNFYLISILGLSLSVVFAYVAFRSEPQNTDIQKPAIQYSVKTKKTPPQKEIFIIKMMPPYSVPEFETITGGWIPASEIVNGEPGISVFTDRAKAKEYLSDLERSQEECFEFNIRPADKKLIWWLAGAFEISLILVNPVRTPSDMLEIREYYKF